MKYHRITALLAASLMLSSCADSTKTEQTAGTESTDSVSSAQTDNTPLSETEISESMDISESETSSENSSGNMGENDFFITVTNYEGNEQMIFYIFDGQDSYAYMDDVHSDPEATFGYCSVLASETPAAQTDFDMDKLREILSRPEMTELSAGYSISENVPKTADGLNSEEEENKTKQLIAEFEPEYVVFEEPDKMTYEYLSQSSAYTEDKPLDSIYFHEKGKNYSNSSISFYYFSSSVSFSFLEYEGRIIGRMSYTDFGTVSELMGSGDEPLTPEQLADAYSGTTMGISDWFYADECELYNFVLECLLLTPSNAFSGVNQYEAEEVYLYGSNFSDNIAAYFNTDSSSLSGYSEEKTKDNVSVMLPDSGKASSPSGLMITWKKDNISFKLSSGSEWFKVNGVYSKDYDICEKGTFNGKWCEYDSVYSPDESCWYDNLSFYGNDDIFYKACFRLEGSERTEEYEEAVRNVLGSINAADPFAAEQTGEAMQSIHAKIKLGEESPYDDEGYKLIGSYSDNSSNVFKAYTPFQMCVSYYTVDRDEKYETKDFGYTLEKYEADGKWYEVLPVAEMIQENSSPREIYDAFSSGRIHVVLDSPCYPPLPEGKYRLAMPFRKLDSDDGYSGAFYEFEMSERIDGGEGYGARVHVSNNYENEGEIRYKIVFPERMFWAGTYADIEYCENGEWVSVRTSPIRTNSLVYPYSLASDSMTFTLESSDYDLSRKGKYRVRASVAADDGGDFSDKTETIYGEFEIK